VAVAAEDNISLEDEMRKAYADFAVTEAPAGTRGEAELGSPDAASVTSSSATSPSVTPEAIVEAPTAPVSLSESEPGAALAGPVLIAPPEPELAAQPVEAALQRVDSPELVGPSRQQAAESTLEPAVSAATVSELPVAEAAAAPAMEYHAEAVTGFVEPIVPEPVAEITGSPAVEAVAVVPEEQEIQPAVEASTQSQAETPLASDGAYALIAHEPPQPPAAEIVPEAGIEGRVETKIEAKNEAVSSAASEPVKTAAVAW
jgi:hypothetical protein